MNPSQMGDIAILGRLRSLGLIDYPAPGQVAAQQLLFPEGVS